MGLRPSTRISRRLGVVLITLAALISLHCTSHYLKAGSGESARARAGSVETAHVEFEFPPQLVSMSHPDYPLAARKGGAEDIVLVQVLVGEDGHVHATRIIKSVPGLDEVSIAAAQGSVWKPATRKDRPVAVWMVIPVEFRLNR
jgi:TonB family protein